MAYLNLEHSLTAVAMNLKRNTFNKQERLKKKRIIGSVYQHGNKLFDYPILLRWVIDPLPTKYPVQLLVGVSRRYFKKAVERNRIKRLIREAYRKNKHIIYPALETNGEQMAIAINYTGKKMPRYQDIENKIIILLQRLARQYEKV